MPASTQNNELANLSNEEIEILFHIVNTAQSLPDLPFRALFTAYDTVLAQHGVDKSQDRLLFRFLLRMGDGLSRDGNLYSRFQELLAEVGIHVDVVGDGDRVDEITRDLNYLEMESSSPVPEGNTTGPVSRRASFSAQGKQPWKATGNDAPVGRRYLQGVDRKGRSSSVASAQGISRRIRSDTGAQSRPSQPWRGRVDSRSASERFQTQRPRRTLSTSSRGSLRIHRLPLNDQEEDFMTDSEAYNSSVDNAHVPAPLVPSHTPWKPLTSQMRADAETFLQRCTLTTCRRLLARWRDRTQELQAQQERCYKSAAAKDRRDLMLEAFEQWRMKFLYKKQVAETERFFGQLERRAGKARDLFLLTKAFTHWAQSASDEVQRTSVARRHILRTKYFNAWKDITAVNELKVQRHVLQKFLGKWRKCTAPLIAADAAAADWRQQKLLKRVYWIWFWEFCETRAPGWNANRLKSYHFGKWLDATDKLRIKERRAIQTRSGFVKGSTLGQWREKLYARQQHVEAAEDFRRQKLLATALLCLRRQAQLESVARQVVRNVDSHIRQSMFETWLLRSRQNRRACDADKLRLLRKSWSSWNDGLRCRVIGYQIDSRLKAETMYKWLLVYRSSLLQRVTESRIKRNLFLGWHQKQSAQIQQVIPLERQAENFRRTRLLRTPLNHLCTGALARQQKAQRASAIYASKLCSSVLQKWNNQTRHISELHERADDARFFVLTTHALKSWREATHHSRRLRRREAYATVRRQGKINLIKRVFTLWQEASVQPSIMERRAVDSRETRLLQLAISQFTHWRDQTTLRIQQNEQAEEFCQRRLLIQAFSLWAKRLATFNGMYNQAAMVREEVQYVVAASCLRALSRRSFHLQRQSGTSVALRERNFQQHQRTMLRHWAEAATARQRLREEPRQELGDGADHQAEEVGAEQTRFQRDPVTSPSPLPRGNRSLGRETSDFLGGGQGDWNVFDDTAFDIANMDIDLGMGPPSFSLEPPLITSTPMPAYLRTPSKRSTARAKIRERRTAQEERPASSSAGYHSSIPIPSFSRSSTGAPLTATSHYNDSRASTTPTAYSTHMSMPATAPAAVAPANLTAGGKSVSSFDQRLRAQNNANIPPMRTPASTSRLSSGPGRFGRGGPWTGGRGSHSTNVTAFTPGGFEDIAEDDGSRGGSAVG